MWVFQRCMRKTVKITYFFSLFEILQMKSASYGDFFLTLKLSETYLKVKKTQQLLYLNNFVISLFYTEYKVVFKSEISNTKPRNWYFGMSNVKEMRDRERTCCQTYSQNPNGLMKYINSNKSACLAKWNFGGNIFSGLIKA